MKSAQAASEIKPTLQQIYINKFNRKLKSMGKDTVTNINKKPSKPWWIYPAGRKKFTQRLKMPQKIFQQQFLNKQIMSPTFPFNQNKNVDLTSDMEIIKITTIVETIRQKRENNARMLEAAKNIQKIIAKKRSKRSSYESENNSTVTKDPRRSRQEKTFVSNKKSRHPKRNEKQQTRNLPTRKLRNGNASDLKTANNVAIPSTVFYKRIWEYINGTRPHSDIISGYNSLENNSEKNNSTCTDKDRITASQSQEDKLQATSPDIKPEREFYKRIWDIINATQLNGNAKARSRRNASIPKSNATLTPLCIQEQTMNYEEDKQVQATNEKTTLNITDINSPDISETGPYISGFWTVVNKTQWQPKKIPIVNIAKLNNDPILSPLVNSASEVDDLNKFPDKVANFVDSLDNSTGYINKAHNSAKEIITKPGPPYSSEESFASSVLPTESTVDKPSQEKDQTERAENDSTGTTPDYDPLNIPYVEVPDYSDQQEDSLDKSNQSATAARYKEYDDYDYSPKRLHDAGDFSSKSPSAEIKVVQTETDEPDTSLNNSRSSCTENKDSIECVDKYDVEDTTLRNNTKNVTDDNVHRSAEDSAETASEENENSDIIDFDEYKKPINWDEFFKNDPILESIRVIFSKKHDNKENPDRTEESEEVKTYATDPKEQSYDYFTNNEDSYGDHVFDDRNKTKEDNDFYAKKETKESETIDKNHHPYNDKDFFKHIFGKDSDKKSNYKENYKKNSDHTKESEEVETYATDSKEHKENPDRTKEFEEIETYATDSKEHNENSDSTKESEEVKTYATDLKKHKENPNRIEESKEPETYVTDPKEQTQDYFAKNEDYYDNHRIASDDVDEASDREEETDFYAKKEEEESEIIDKDPLYDDKDFFKHIFGNDNDKESSDIVDTENEFLSRYFTKDVLRQLRDNSTAEEDRQREESRNKEDIHKTLSRILDKKDQFSRLDDNLNKMIEKGEAIPIKYNNFWSLEYESPRKRNKDNKKEIEDSKEEA